MDWSQIRKDLKREEGPDWLTAARKYIGVSEIVGKDTSPVIARWLIRLKAWWRDDETPWCGTFVAACMSEAGVLLPKHWYRARDWLNWGASLASPVVGCVVIYERKGGGHVGFVVGQDQHGNLMTLGGNQGNRVSIRPFLPERALGYRWPNGRVVVIAPLPIVDSDGRISTQEA